LSLGIAFKGAEGIVLAADSRVTLTNMVPNRVPGQPTILLSATFDNATKLLYVKGQPFVGAVTFGLGAIGQQTPRTAASYMPEFEAELLQEKKPRIKVEDFAKKLSSFFMQQWKKASMPNPPPPGNEMVFLVGGYDENEPYGRVFALTIPIAPEPVEQSPDLFGATWGGQREFVDRLIQGFDPNLPGLVRDILKGPQEQRPTEAVITDELRKKLMLPIPWQFLPLQDCVDLCVFLVRTTIELQQWLMYVRGVGGAIDVATITRSEGFKALQIKEVRASKLEKVQ
jgi:hypothetical protein